MKSKKKKQIDEELDEDDFEESDEFGIEMSDGKFDGDYLGQK